VRFFLGLSREGRTQVKLKLFAFLLGILCSLSVAAQTPATPLVTQPVDESKLVPFRGTVHQLAQARYDRGAVNPSTPAERLLLVLNRPPEREAAFQQLLIDLHTPGSPSYHHWLTPDQIGAQFGPAGSDMDAVTGWLRGSGFNVSRVSRAQRFIEFSGTVGQVNSAFHTEIHEYMVNGALHHANSTAVQIPQALAGIVKGLSPLHDFRPAPLLEQGGRGHYDAASRQFVPEFNLPSNWTPLLYGVVPADFYTQYDLAPLYAANVTGAGKTIGIIDESNIDVGLANDYRSLFGVTANPVQVVLDGGDPGMSSSDTETYLDVELAGAVAPGATVNLYLSAGSAYQDPLALAALRAVDDNQADVLSVSWGSSEQELEASGNQLWDGLWEQAAAQGQTVLVATGDYGQVPGEEYFFTGGEIGPAVNGLASTPWNVAVGGTDFYYSDYASGAPSASTFWNATNDPVTKGSLKAPLTEQVWNDPFGLDPISDGLQRGEIYAGGGGASSCAILAAGATCQAGYAKPSWQTGAGIPADGVRDIPDVALFASNGASYSGYITCDYEGACVPDSSGNFGFDLVGGTSASTPAMAGIMALVDQKYGRQGQADATLYPLAQQKPSAFHDITLGGNWDICVQGDADCALGVAGMGPDGGESTVYSATPGFDLASGWGSVDAANLVNNWNAITFQSTSTTLQVSPAQITHGANVTLTADVSAASGSGTPTGAVAILSTSTSPSSASQTAITLNAGSGSAMLNNLPGGTYQLSARYGGDGVFSSSASSPQSLTVKPELSKTTLEAFGEYSSTPGTTFNYGELAYLAAQPQGTSSLNDGSATGSVTFTIDNAPTVVPLNVGGVASFVTPILSVGAHTVDASYAGDNSFEASTAAPLSLTVTKGYPEVNINLAAPQEQGGPGWQVNPGGSITVTAFVGPEVGIFTGGVAPVGTVGPTGTVTVCLNTNFNVGSNPCSGLGAGSYSATVALVPATGVYSLYSEAAVTFTNLAAGGYMPQFEYNGDNNWQTFGEFYLDYVNVMAPAAQPTPVVALSIAPGSISGTQEALLTTTVTGTNGVAPTGVVEYFNSGNLFTYDILVPSATGATSTDVFAVSPAWFWNDGANQIVAVYEGDSNYAGATSNAVSLTVSQTIGDFMIAPVAPQVTVASGSTQSLALNLTSVNNFNSTLALTCAPSSTQFSCAVTPASAQLNGTGSATLTVTATIPSATAKADPMRNPARRGWLGAGTAVAFCIVLVLPLRRRRWNGIACLIVLLAASFLSACGSSGSTGTSTPPPPVNGTPAGTYTVLITGTANGITHTSEVTVVVH
jgi:subtilase family serine protease